MQLSAVDGDGTSDQVTAGLHDSVDGQYRIDALLRDLLDTDGVVTVTVARAAPDESHIATPAKGTRPTAATEAEHGYVIPSGRPLRQALQAFLHPQGESERDEDRSPRDSAVIETIERLEGERAGLREALDAVTADRELSRKRLRAAGRALRANNDAFERRIERLDQVIVGLQDPRDSMDVRALEELANARGERVRQLTSELILAEQSERQRIAAILHDDVQQLLYAYIMRIHVLTRGLAAEKGEAIERATSLISRALDVIRNLTMELSPALHEGDDVNSMIDWLAFRMEEMHAMKVEASVPDSVSLSPDVRALVYQIARELLFNVVKHAGTDRARINVLREETQVVLRVEDDGVGFDVLAAGQVAKQQRGFGLRTMLQRLTAIGGRMERDSAPGQGTRITVYVPVTI